MAKPALIPMALKAAGAAATGVTAYAALKGTKTPDIPDTAPAPDDQALSEARRRALVVRQQRMGRASTVLAEGRERLG